MKNLQPSFYNSDNESRKVQLNKDHLLKYIIMFLVITVSTLVIPTCGVLRSQAATVGLLGATTFAILDMCYPKRVYIDSFHGH
tara:strand:- start:4519 stop:4767 length:249 start_codon:yes stop_codon:yes gene_type:complete